MNRFLLGIGRRVSEQSSAPSVSLLAQDRADRLQAAAPVDNPFIEQDEEFDPELDNLISQAFEEVRVVERAVERDITGYSQEAGPSNSNPLNTQRRQENPQTMKEQENPQTPRDRENPRSTANRKTGNSKRSSERSSNLQYAETEQLCTESPFQVVHRA